MKKFLWASLAPLILIFVVGNCSYNKEPDLSLYEGLVHPGIAHVDAQRMLVVKRKGDPNVVAKEAFNVLFKTYYRHAGKGEKSGFKALRARWPVESLSAKMNTWEGAYGLTVSESFPDPQSNDAKLETWEYGIVAEILHKGSYESEPPTVKKLTDFIRENGYRIIGEHEEEYLKGPGMFFKGNPEQYRTIIRYRVEKIVELHLAN